MESPDVSGRMQYAPTCKTSRDAINCVSTFYFFTHDLFDHHITIDEIKIENFFSRTRMIPSTKTWFMALWQKSHISFLIFHTYYS